MKPAVLVVDDNADFRQTLCELIGVRGHRALQASTGDDALQIMSDERIGVLITDISMPGLNGVELIREVRKRSPAAEPKIIVVSGHQSLNRKTKGALTSLGVMAFLTKPFQMDELIEILPGE